MTEPPLNVVTGAFGFTGGHIARLLLARGERVRTITGHPQRHSDLRRYVDARPFDFDNPARLAESLAGAATLFNTYWIRYETRRTTFDLAVKNSRTLIRAAREAGVRKLVHVSIANPSIDCDLPYYRGKALVEQAVAESGLPYAIIRPTVLFGKGGVLINNIAWFLRHMPVFAVPGSGEYQLQPIHVQDVAALAIEHAAGDEDTCLDAAGPETFTFNELLRLLATSTRSRTRIIHLPPGVAAVSVRLLGLALRDTVLTRSEVIGLMRSMLVSRHQPLGRTLLSNWIADNSNDVGRTYISDTRKD